MAEKMRHFSHYRYITGSGLVIDGGRQFIGRKPVNRIFRQIDEQIAAGSDEMTRARLRVEADEVVEKLTYQVGRNIVIDLFPTVGFASLAATNDLPKSIAFSVIALSAMRLAMNISRLMNFTRESDKSLEQKNQVQDAGFVTHPLLPFKQERIKERKFAQVFIPVEVPVGSNA
ncbi:MAG TPA: hypothetical protein VLF20_00085 [Patescibacteria group bacterium]|nr:hypothetical protein [Patescibacteria group bacterium]